MRKDIIWMDYARFIGIFLVIFGHTMQRFPLFEENFYYRDVWNFIYLFHMPLFFVISGYFYKPLTIETELINVKIGDGKIWHQLIKPYLFYQILFLPIAFILYRNELYDSSTFFKLMGGIVMGDGYETPLSLPVHLPCWFIISIIQLRLLFMWIPFNKLSSSLLIIGSFIFLLLRKILGFDLYFCLDSTIMAIPYFIIGYYWAKNKIIEIADKYKILLIPFCVILLCIILFYNGPSQMNGPSYGKNILLNYIAGLTGTIMVFMLSLFFANKWGNKEYIHTISRNTLFIIFSHWVLLIPCGIIAEKMPTFLVNDVFITFMMAIFISIIILHLSKFMISYASNKYPVLFGKHKI